MRTDICEYYKRQTAALWTSSVICGGLLFPQADRGGLITEITWTFPDQREVYREDQQLCHDPDYWEGDICAEVKLSGSEEAVHVV